MWTSNGIKYVMTLITQKNINLVAKMKNVKGSEYGAPHGSTSTGSDPTQSMQRSSLAMLSPTSYASSITLINETDTFTGEGADAGRRTFDFLLGTGTTLPTLDDYKLESVISNTDLKYLSKTYAMSDTAYTFTITEIFTNTTAEDITATEIGVYVPMSAYGTLSGAPALIIREVLDDPIVIKAGATKAITYEVDFSKLNG